MAVPGSEKFDASLLTLIGFFSEPVEDKLDSSSACFLCISASLLCWALGRPRFERSSAGFSAVAGWLNRS